MSPIATFLHCETSLLLLLDSMIIAFKLFGDVSFSLLARYIELLTTELFRFKMAELVIFSSVHRNGGVADANDAGVHHRDVDGN